MSCWLRKDRGQIPSKGSRGFRSLRGNAVPPQAMTVPTHYWLQTSTLRKSSRGNKNFASTYALRLHSSKTMFPKTCITCHRSITHFHICEGEHWSGSYSFIGCVSLVFGSWKEWVDSIPMQSSTATLILHVYIFLLYPFKTCRTYFTYLITFTGPGVIKLLQSWA